MSSRSLAAARARRAGENAPPISGNRPVTSIGSYAAFGQQPPNPSQNVRTARQPQQNAYQQPPSQQNAYQQPPSQPQQQNSNGLPFTKLSISDAIGLITIRLGRVEQWIIETDHENEEQSSSFNIPDNSVVLDNSVLVNFTSRLDSLEKREPTTTTNNSEEVTKLIEDVGKINTHLAKIVEESSKHSLLTAKHTEQLFRFERELIETKDILKTFMLKYDQFASETSDKFGDFEFAISELEKSVQPEEKVENENDSEDLENDEENNDSKNISSEDFVEQTSSIMSVDLKNLIKKELSTSIDE